MFIGYLSSFFIALLLSFFYLSYAAIGVFEQIKKDVNNEIRTELSDTEISSKNTMDIPAFAIDYVVANIPENQQFKYSGYTIDISFVDDDIPIRKAWLSDYYLRPPPKISVL
jgi:hypothetical protein